MIPISLTLSGIYSYQQPQSIDFSRLTEASIFGIFGTVGSGKSTILEAISYALYGETERLNQRENRGYNMMNLKSNELLIDFIFQAGQNEQVYRFKVSGKRNRNHFEKINTFDRTAYRQEGEEWIPIEVTSAEQIIGLSYQNFRRTIIIPQGKFQEFLQLGDTDRTRMMKELFNLNKFELSRKVDGLDKKNEKEKLILEDRLKQMGEIHADQIEPLKESLRQLKAALEVGTQLLADKQQVDSAFSQLKELFERIDQQHTTLTSLQTQENQFKDLEDQIHQYDYCQLHFKSLLENQRQVQKEISRLSSAINQQHATLQSIHTKLSTEEAVRNQLESQYESREMLKSKANELEKVIQILSLEAQAAQLRERMSNGEMHHSLALNKVGKNRQDQEALSAEIKSLKANLPDTTELTAVSNWFVRNNQLLNLKKSLLQEAELAKSKLQQVKKNKEELLSSAILQLIPGATKESPGMELLAAFTEAKTALEQQLTAINAQLQHLLLQSKLEEYAIALHDGTACPLCGSLEHPHKLDASEVSSILSETQGEKLALQAQITQIVAAEKKLNTILVQYVAQKEVLDGILLKGEAQETEIASHYQAFPWANFSPDDEAHLQKILAESIHLQKQVQEKESKLENLSTELANEEKNRDTYQKALSQFQQKLAEINGKIGSYNEQLSQLNISDYAHQRSEQLQHNARQWMDEYNQIEISYQGAEKNIQALKVEMGTLSGSLKAGEENLGTYQSHAEALSQQIDQQLSASTFASLDEVFLVLNSPLNLDQLLEQEKSRVTAFRQQLHTATAQYQILLEQAKGKSYNLVAHTELLEEIAKLRDEKNAQRRQLILLEGEITKLEKDLSLRKELLRKVDALRQRAEDITTLKKLFRESGFVNYVSSVYLQNLCKSANERFYKLTRQKLQLEITDKNEFQIRDFLHNGQVRSVKTLSGGQTFQAALCLALALADNIQQLTHSSQNFFFLDEGFGSLDKESLQVVFETLKSLRKENRIVGVISHVEEMQHEIETYLQITNDEVTGSLVKRSWL